MDRSGVCVRGRDRKRRRGRGDGNKRKRENGGERKGEEGSEGMEMGCVSERKGERGVRDNYFNPRHTYIYIKK